LNEPFRPRGIYPRRTDLFKEDLMATRTETRSHPESTPLFYLVYPFCFVIALIREGWRSLTRSRGKKFDDGINSSSVDVPPKTVTGDGGGGQSG
jgi:hypothetical protein